MEKDYLNHFENFLNYSLPHQGNLKEIIKYSLFPTGKLFRPNLCLSLAKDLKTISKEDIYYLAHFCELHHTYSLIHDDLPSMDNDDYRRGRLSSHKKFGEASAILAGDALLNLSYEALSNIKIELQELLKFVTKCMGPKGLILGQELDLKASIQAPNDVFMIHKLKTSRLIQVAIVGTHILSKEPSNKRWLDFYRLGNSLGILFQLLDDYDERLQTTSPREKEINPYYRFSEEFLNQKILEEYNFIQEILNIYSLKNLKSYLDLFFKKSNFKF